MNVDGGLLGAERAKQRQEQEQMKSAAQRVMVNDSSSGKFTLVDMSDDADARMVTRYEADSLSLVLLHDYQGRIQLLGGNEGSAVHLPHRGDDAAILALEETVMLSSVSFPWQGPPQRRRTDDRLEVLEKWWTLRHPHDNRVFVLLNADGTFTHEDFTGSYRRGAEGEDFEGLTIQARRNQEVPYDEL